MANLHQRLVVIEALLKLLDRQRLQGDFYGRSGEAEEDDRMEQNEERKEL